MKLEGGFPRCALTFLTGGITTSDLIDSNDIRKEVSHCQNRGELEVQSVLQK